MASRLPVEFSDTISIIIAAFATVLVSEVIAWFFVYRTEKYEKLKKDLEAAKKKQEKQKEAMVSSSRQKTQNRKLAHRDTTIKSLQSEMSQMKMKATFFFLFATLAYNMNEAYYGIPVAKLPFASAFPFTYFTHSGLPGSDTTECSKFFLHFMTSVVLRPIIQRFMGLDHTESQMAQMPFQPDMDQLNKKYY
eukprot:CAMPEP_0115043452 /NCGR_PEP_ID=MMETSP0216-20121206/46881_1 /TAXON_ID=223996 /ORGANISM="Protocruzia adherens, Strain Boccale" /LENGTH=191 /DNA_ID=CAMNT_0002425783 /DNA_START=40 /DNA_END=615 /DNA_ORIENTATION=+